MYFIEDENLVAITLEEPKSQVDNNLEQISRWVYFLIVKFECMKVPIFRSLEELTSRTIRVLVYDTREYNVTMQVLQPSRKRQNVATVTIIRYMRLTYVIGQEAYLRYLTFINGCYSSSLECYIEPKIPEW